MAGDDSVPGVLVCHPCGCHVPPRPATSLVLGLSRITRHRLVSEMSRCIRASGIGRRAKGFSFACWRFAKGPKHLPAIVARVAGQPRDVALNSVAVRVNAAPEVTK